MNREVFLLATQGVRRKKKSSILIFFVLLISFSFAIISLSLVGSISKTNAEFRLNTYGEWYFAIPSGKAQDGEWLKNESWAEKVGIAWNYGTVSGANRATGFGTVNETLKKIGRLKLDDGVWPVQNNEIALEADILGLLGYNYNLGQEITLQIAVPCEDMSVYVEQTYILCGIIHEYTDLWVLNQNANAQLLNGAVVTEEAAKHLLEVARFQLEESMPEQILKVHEPIPQYFIDTPHDSREQDMKKIQEYLESSRSSGTGDNLPCVNLVAYPEGGGTSAVTQNTATTTNRFYIYAIAAVTVLAVLCIYIMQLPVETHSFAVLRSIGITKRQMAQLLFTESMLLCLPAIVLGIPFGMGLTWLGLNLAMYAGSVEVQVVIPFSVMIPVILLWIMMILLSRLIVFVVTVCTTLTGNMQLQRGKTHRTKMVRSGFITLLLSIFCFITIFTALKVLSPKDNMKYWASESPYTVWVSQGDSELLAQSQLDLIERVPGISNAVGYSPMQIEIAFDGMEISRTSYGKGSPVLLSMYAIDAADWKETFDFGMEREAFDNGELVLLCFPDDRNPLKKKENPILPTGKIQIRAYAGELYKDHGRGNPIIPKPSLIFASKPIPVSIQWISYGVPHRKIPIEAPYTVFCSNAYVEKLISSFKPGSKWEGYVAGEELGYRTCRVYVDKNAEDLSTDKVIADICEREGLGIDNCRQEYMAHIQENLQELILLYFSGICIALMALLICFAALALEAEQEKYYYRIMRVVGMSLNQMRINVIRRSFGRSCVAVFAGWLCYFGYVTVMEIKNGKDFWNAIRGAVPYLMIRLGSTSTDISYILILTLVCLLVSFVLSVIAKSKLRKESWIS